MYGSEGLSFLYSSSVEIICNETVEDEWLFWLPPNLGLEMTKSKEFEEENSYGYCGIDCCYEFIELNNTPV